MSSAGEREVRGCVGVGSGPRGRLTSPEFELASTDDGTEGEEGRTGAVTGLAVDAGSLEGCQGVVA